MLTRRNLLLTLITPRQDEGFALRGRLRADQGDDTYATLGEDLTLVAREGSVIHGHLRALAGWDVLLRIDRSGE